MFKLLRVNMSTEQCVFVDIPAGYAGMGGRGLTSAIIGNEVDPNCHPLGLHNKLVFAPGLLGGTLCPNSGRISVGCKSPLTGGIKEANSGGQPGGHLAKLGIMGIVIEGMAGNESMHLIDRALVRYFSNQNACARLCRNLRGHIHFRSGGGWTMIPEQSLL